MQPTVVVKPHPCLLEPPASKMQPPAVACPTSGPDAEEEEIRRLELQLSILKKRRELASPLKSGP
jgi:hypothetical protein